MDATYRIPDEPRPSGLAHLVVNPFWPLLASMLAGTWLALPWFVFNGFALGSATRRRELVLAGVWLPGMFLLLVVLGAAHEGLALPEGAAPYLAVLLIVWKLAMAYFLYNLQQRSFALHEYFGGTVRNGLPVLLLGFYFGNNLMRELGKLSGLWTALLG